MRIQEKDIQDKTLYVCVNNVGRSQMGERFHNHFAPGEAESAGIAVDQPGGQVADWVSGAEIICRSMEEIGLSISENIRTQYDEERARQYARVVFMLEPEQIPADLDMHGGRKLYWPMRDPRGMGIEDVRTLRDNIRQNVGLWVMNGCVEFEPQPLYS